MQGCAFSLRKAVDRLPTVFTEKFNGYEIPQEQLYVLTGYKPEFNDKTIRKGVDGPHLRFVFSDKNDNFQYTILMLRFYQIKYCDDLFKPESHQYCITVAPTEFANINALFTKDTSRKKSKSHIDYDALEPKQRLWLINLIFCAKTFAKLEQRYAETLSKGDKYTFDGLMAFHKDFVKKSVLCLEYLLEKKTVNEPLLPEPDVLPKAITPRLHIQPLSPFSSVSDELRPQKKRRLGSSI